MLEARNIIIERKHRTVLELEDVFLNAGELVMLLGPNGAGKSTLLNTLCGDLKSTHKNSRVLLNEKPLKDYSLKEKAQQLAVLPQKSDIPFPLSVLEVVLLGRTPYDSTHAENHVIARQCLEKVDMIGAENKFYSELSGGEQQRVQIARVLAQLVSSKNISRYLLLDEPVSALDLFHQHLLLKYLREITQNKIGVMMTVHDLNLALAYADRVVLLKEGRELSQGKPVEVLTADNIQKVFALKVELSRVNNKLVIIPSDN